MDRRRSHAEEAPLAAGIPEAPPASLVLAPPEAAAPTQTAKRSLAQEPRANETRALTTPKKPGSMYLSS